MGKKGVLYLNLPNNFFNRARIELLYREGGEIVVF